MKKLVSSCVFCLAFSSITLSQVDTSYVFNTNMPYGTLDIRIAKSATRYYYLQPGKTISFRERNGVKTNTYRDMTSWNSSAYTEGNLREKNGSRDYFIMNYRLLFPVNYQASYADGYPLIVMMHGVGERGNCWDSRCYHADRTWSYQKNSPPAPTTADHQLLNNDHNLLHGGKVHLDARNAAGTRLPHDPGMPTRAFPGFVLFPQNLNGWSGGTVQDAIRLVRLVAKKYNVNPDRIYIHGLSNGGYATYDALKRAPWLFAAALPMSAVSDGGILSQNMVSATAHIPLWIFQGGRDSAPSPSKTNNYIKRFREAGAIVRYTLYENLGHGVWNSAYSEPDFFSWILSQNKSKLHMFAGNAGICKTNGKGVKLELAAGFYRYQWERNGAIISGATGNTYTANTPGTYRARFSRVPNPTAAQWNDWSDPVTVTEQNPPQAKIDQTGTVLLRDLNNYSNARLKAVGDHAHYYWYKDGALLNLNTQEALIRPGNCTSTCTSTGVYTLITAGFDNCPSPRSEPKTLYFNNQAPINITAPGNFKAQALSSTGVSLTWTQSSSNEQGFEIWRRKVSGSTTSPWEMPVLTGANATSYTDKGLEPNATYHYKIRAVSSAGRSNYTPSASNQYVVVTTSDDTVNPSAPASLTARQSAINTITLSWRAATDNIGIREYIIYYGTKSVATGTAVTSFTLKNLTLNTHYSFTVKAEDLAGNLSTASNTASANTYVTGLYYEHSTGAWSNLDAINWNTVEYSGTVRNFSLAPRTQEDYFNFRFDGYLYINTGGSYEFRTVSSDGSRVELNGVVVVDNNGLHDNRTATGAAQSLTAGAKRIVVKYFEYAGTQSLTVSYRGPDTGGSWMNIPDAALRSSNATASLAAVEEAQVTTVALLDDAAVSVYPNPATQHDIHVQMDEMEDGPVHIQLLDMRGRPLYEQQFMQEDVLEGVHLSPNVSLTNGLYLIVVQQNKKTSRKIIAIRN